MVGLFLVHICTIITFTYMKKGEKLLATAYFLEIKDLRNIPVSIGTYRSLRDAVKWASEYVQNMDNYPKVRREAAALGGVFAGVYFAKHDRKASSHLLVLIRSSKIEYSDKQDLANQLDAISEQQSERIEEGIIEQYGSYPGVISSPSR